MFTYAEAGAIRPAAFRRFIVCIAFLMTLAAFPSFSEGIQEPGKKYSGKEGKITVYLSGPEQMLSQIEKSFESQHGDVLDFVIMGCGPLRQRVWTEFESGSINADVFWGSDPLVYYALDKRGALEAYKPKGTENLKDVYQTAGNFTLVNERYGVVIYNKEKLTDSLKPSSFADLLKPEYKGGIIHADPNQSSAALSLICGLWDMHGKSWDFHKGLAANELFLAKKNSDVPSKIQEKEFDIGIAPHDEALRIQAKAKKEGYPTPLEICWPEEGGLAIQRPIAISANDSRPEANSRIAHDFVDFMIAEKAQKITTMFGFISVRKDVPLPAGIPADLKITPVDWEYLSDHAEEIQTGFKNLF